MTVVVQLPETPSVALLAPLRWEDGVDVAEAGDSCVWLRAQHPSPGIMTRLAGLAGTGVYEGCGRGLLRLLGRQVPSAVIPADLEWVPLRQWLRPNFPSPQMPGAIDKRRLSFRLCRGPHSGGEANALVTDAERWHAYAEMALERRLRPLRFAMSRDGRVVVLGTPLPSLKARLYYLTGGVAIPWGLEFEFSFTVEGLRRWLGLAAGELAWFHDDGTFERIRQDDFLQAGRSAVRLSFQHWQDAGSGTEE